MNLPALEEFLVLFSHLVAEQRWIREIDINSVLASPERIVALERELWCMDLRSRKTNSCGSRSVPIPSST